MAGPILSYVCGTSDTPLKYQTVGAILEETAKAHPSREALVSCHQDVRYTYSELNQRVTELASGLLALGLEPGDRLGIWSPNCVEWVLTQLATAKAGIILVTINPAYRVSELEYALNKAGCQALIHADRFKSSDYIAMIEELAPEVGLSQPGALEALRLPELKYVITIADSVKPGFMRFDEIGNARSEASNMLLKATETTLSPDDAINIQFTSGTTGFPKGATLTHHNILNNGYFVAARQHFTEQDRLCIPVPLYHCFGMVMGVLGCVSHGACMVFPDEAFDATSVLKTIEAEKCTALYGVPTMFIGELDHPDFTSFDLSTLRTGTMAGSPCPIEIMKRVISEMNMQEVTIAYGMTETSPVSFQSKPSDSIEKRVSTVGQIHPFVEVKIIGEDGETLARGAQGELCTRGYSVMLGYWEDEEKTSEAIDEAGWMHTGDLATMDDEGYVNITGRVKDMIIRGGENVYPREVEEYLYRHEAIQDVQVFGVPDNKYGEEIACWIIPRGEQSLTAEDVVAFCKGQIAHYKMPRHIRIVDEFPMTVTGKIQKFIMRDMMIEELGISVQKTA